MNNSEIAAALDELADLNELDGAVVYRVVAYRQGARAVRESPVAVKDPAKQGRLSSLEELRTAAQQERLRNVPGLGPKAERNILEMLAKPVLTPDRSRRLLSKVLPIAEDIVAQLRAHPASEKVELAGSARRMTETCKDVDIIATASEPRALSEALTRLDLVQEGRAAGAGGRVVTHTGVSIDLRVVAPNQFGNVLQHLTGSKQHN